MASVKDVMSAVNAATAGTGFSCKTVSWEDAQRGHTSGGGLSCMGPNISDVRLYEKTGQLLYTVRSDNWNERLGYVAAKDVAMVTGNEQPVASVLTPTSLHDYLQTFGDRAKYVQCTQPTSLLNFQADSIFGVRFQTVFLPVGDVSSDDDSSSSDNDDDAPCKPRPVKGSSDEPTTTATAVAVAVAPPPTTEFCTEVYNYQTRSDSDPRNMLLLATPQGTSVQQDGVGCCRQYFHSVDSTGTVHRYWLEAEKSEKAVGGPQEESRTEQLAAATRGKAVAVALGPKSMGTRFNVQMLIQVPLMQKPPPVMHSYANLVCRGGRGGGRGGRGGGGSRGGGLAKGKGKGAELPASKKKAACKRSRSATAPVGVSNAARVSRGSEVDTYDGLTNQTPRRDPVQHGTITITMYYTVVGGVPSAADVKAAIDDLDALYKQCPSDKKLVDCGEVTMPGMSGPCLNAGCQCPQGHAMCALTTAAAPGVDLYCDGCERLLEFYGGGSTKQTTKDNGNGSNGSTKDDAAAEHHRCHQCDFDLCWKCVTATKCPNGRSLLRPGQTKPARVFGARKKVVQCELCHGTFASTAAVRECRSATCSHSPYVVCEGCAV